MSTYRIAFVDHPRALSHSTRAALTSLTKERAYNALCFAQRYRSCLHRIFLMRFRQHDSRHCGPWVTGAAMSNTSSGTPPERELAPQCPKFASVIAAGAIAKNDRANKTTQRKIGRFLQRCLPMPTTCAEADHPSTNHQGINLSGHMSRITRLRERPPSLGCCPTPAAICLSLSSVGASRDNQVEPRRVCFSV